MMIREFEEKKTWLQKSKVKFKRKASLISYLFSEIKIVNVVSNEKRFEVLEKRKKECFYFAFNY